MLQKALLIVALLSAIWFAATAWFWIFFTNLVFAYPFGLLALLLWLGQRKGPLKAGFRWVKWILLVGFSVSIAMFVFLVLNQALAN